MGNDTIGGQVPGSNYDVVQRLVELERVVRGMTSARTLGSSSIGDGSLTVNGGAIRIVDGNGNLIGFIGTDAGGNTGFFVQRPDGSSSFYAWTSGGGFAAMFDRASNYVITDDATSGQGVARPYIPIGMFADNTSPTATTTSTTFATLQTLVGYKQHPKITAQVLVRAISAGEVRLVDQDGVQIGSTQTFAAGAFQYATIQGPIAGTHMKAISLNLQARITSGSSTIGVRGVAAWGVESAAF